VVVYDDTVVELTPEQIAAHDDQRDLGTDAEAALVAAYRGLFGVGGFVLDAGGGSGTAAPALRASGSHVVIADWSFTMLAAAADRADLRCAADLRRLPFKDHAFAGVHAAYAIQNVTDWGRAVSECVRVTEPGGPVAVAWGGPPADDRLAGVEGAFFAALGDAAGVRAQATGITIDAANSLFADLGRPLRDVVTVEGTHRRTPRQVANRASMNPYRSRAEPVQRQRALEAALAWATAHIGPVDVPVAFRIVRVHHIYR
jgi:SAM-dependent methyltransferase